jgi:hypothetical protein
VPAGSTVRRAIVIAARIRYKGNAKRHGFAIG